MVFRYNKQIFSNTEKMNRKTKQIAAGLVVLLQFVYVIPSVANGEVSGKSHKLMVTAYYSPLPNQNFYIRGNYEADIRLNGRGVTGADGTKVYEGMLAAPSAYPYGARIRIPGLGVGEVHDRGGAILAGKDYDRIDVWMGYGEEGLSRALNWGARIVDGVVFPDPDQVEPIFSYSGISASLPEAFIKRLKNASEPTAPADSSLVNGTPDKKADTGMQDETLTPQQNKEMERLEQNRTLLAAGIGKDDNGADVENLQRMLWELGYYQGDITGKYDSMTMDGVFRFQVDHGVLKSEVEKGAGYFGKKTLEAMLTAIEDKIQALSKYPKEVQIWVPAKQVLPQIGALKAPESASERQDLVFADDLVNKKIVQTVRLSGQLELQDQGDEVMKLQNFLISRGYLGADKNTGLYGEQTEAAVLKFQLEQGIISSPDAQGAGRVGPQTLAVINSL